MRNTIIIWLLFTITILSGCSNANPSNEITDTAQPLTRSQIDEIITATNGSMIQEIDFSQVTKSDPAQQADMNEKMRHLGEKLNGKVTIENTNIVIARVNGEAITASDWYFEKSWEVGKAETRNKRIPSDKELFNNLIKAKAISSTARSLGLYPPEDQVNAYMADQRKCLEELKPEELTVLLNTWSVSEEEYLLLMRDCYTDSLANVNWHIYLEKYEDHQEDVQKYTVKNPQKIYDDKIMKLVEEAEVEVTSEGYRLGISTPSTPNQNT
ncbi:MAG: hypothetical protein U9N81_06965 [Bacillota bacterium]|nr:hypothetical protein [Bacillota bacterium]